MTQVTRLQALRYALHADSVTFSGTPGTLVPLQLMDDGASFLPRQRTPIERPLRSLGGRQFTHIYGSQDVADLVAVCEFKGVNSNTGGAVSDWEAKMEQGYLLASLFGAVAPATTGDAPTVNSTGHTPASGVLGVDANSANTANGQVIAFETDEGMQMGIILSGGGTSSVTLDHRYFGTPVTGATIYRMAVYTVDDDLTRHTHCFFSAEGENWRRDYFGCTPMSMALAMPNTGLVQMTSTWSPTSWADVAEANTAYAAPTAGEPVVMDGVTMIIAGTQYLVSNLSISMSNGAAIRETASNVNGKLGGVCGTGDGKMFTIEGEIEMGTADLDGITYFNDSSLANLSGTTSDAGDVSTAREIALMVGTDVGRLIYVHLKEADFRCAAITSGAFTKVRFTAMGTGDVPATFAVG